VAEFVGHDLDHRPLPVVRPLPCEEANLLLSEDGNALTCIVNLATCLAAERFRAE
jgi:hypothetical protein